MEPTVILPCEYSNSGYSNNTTITTTTYPSSYNESTTTIITSEESPYGQITDRTVYYWFVGTFKSTIVQLRFRHRKQLFSNLFYDCKYFELNKITKIKLSFVDKILFFFKLTQKLPMKSIPRFDFDQRSTFFASV